MKYQVYYNLLLTFYYFVINRGNVKMFIKMHEYNPEINFYYIS